MKGSEWVKTLPEQPGFEREAMIIDAVERGYGLTAWNKVVSELDGHKLELGVFGQALGVGEVDDWVRVATTCRTAQRVADQLGCLMLTPKLSDMMWLQATNELNAIPQLRTPDATMDDTSTFVSVSKTIDGQVAGRPGISCPEGKDFVLCQRVWQKPGYAANYGWQVQSGSKYRGVTAGVQVLQPLGMVHILDFTDYSQMCKLVSRQARLDGKDVDLANVYVDPDLAMLVSHEGALSGWRYPGVDPEVPELEESGAKPWRDPTKTWGQRALAYTLSQMGDGVKEEPLGSNGGPDIARYFGPAVRIFSDGVERKLGISRGNWCCVSACAAMRAATLTASEEPPHGYRAGVVEVVEDSKRDDKYSSGWVSIEAVRSGARQIHVGDLAIFDRSDHRPHTQWWRHVARVETLPDAGGGFYTIGGNEKDRYERTARNLDNKRLLGFVVYPQHVAEVVAPEQEWTDNERQHYAHLIRVSEDVMWGRYGLDYAFDDFREEDFD